MGSTSSLPPNNTTPFRQAIQASRERGVPAVGSWLTLPGFTLARTVAATGPDWVLVDCEHGNVDDAAMYHSVAAIAAAGASPIVRVPWAEPWLIKRALDSGAHGIMVPMVETKEQAELVAWASHYTSTEFPAGVRGCGGAFAPANLGLGAAAYHRQANELLFVIVQIESQLGVANAADIAAVPGIDGLFIGPADLASSMGYFPYDFASIPAVLEAADSVRVAAKAAGKAAGHFCMNAADVLAKAEAGWDFMNCGADIVALGAWMGREMAQIKSSIATRQGENNAE